jgi:hypothetical protein
VPHIAWDNLICREQGVAHPVELVPTLDGDGEIYILSGAARGNPEDVEEH